MLQLLMEHTLILLGIKKPLNFKDQQFMKLEHQRKGLNPIKNLMLIIVMIIMIKMINGFTDHQLIIMIGNGDI